MLLICRINISKNVSDRIVLVSRSLGKISKFGQFFNSDASTKESIVRSKQQHAFLSIIFSYDIPWIGEQIVHLFNLPSI